MSQVVKIYTVCNLAQELRQEGREMKDGLYSMCGRAVGGGWVVGGGGVESNFSVHLRSKP